MTSANTQREHTVASPLGDENTETRPPEMSSTTVGQGPAKTPDLAASQGPLPPFSGAWVEELRKVIREELERIFAARFGSEVPPLMVRSTPPSPPEDALHQVSRACLPPASVDMVLLHRFEEECAAHGGSADRTMEYILWNFFGKPCLSFQVLQRLCMSRSFTTRSYSLEDTVDY